ncbi:MAG: starch-binding protein [Muribaculaceae bacterium]|nr:starch-binding protein [Muribaculaceae bacterium]
MYKPLSRALTIASLCFAFNASAANSYGLPENCQDGTILHCFDWSFNQIKEELPNIAAAGFTSVQTSPSQGNAGNNATWYFAYQPYDFTFAEGGLGSKQDLKNLCTEAEKYGIKVIVDVVSNHLNGSMNYVNPKWHDNQYWHTHGSNIDYNNRWQVTHGDIGMRDLNSEHATVYNAVRAYVDELKSYGVDGIRWDAAKHIGLPSEGCDFWSAVTKDSGMWHYGEILIGPTDGGGNDHLMKEYTNYISVTDNTYGRDMRYAIQGGNGYSSPGNWANRGVATNKIVYWPESHDTYANDGKYGEDSRTANVNQINRTYALLASRASSTALYFSRPTSTSANSIRLGQKGGLDFKNTEVAAVNHFHNAMIGQKDYYVSENGTMAVCREKGVVVVKASGSGNVSISNGGGIVAPGTYKDQITGNTWTVTASKITGTVGSTGIAVVYNADGITPDIPEDNPGDNTESQYTAYFDNKDSNWENVYAYAWDNSNTSNQFLGTWPGSQISKDSESGYYKVTASIQATTPMIIFNDGSGNQTSDFSWVNNGIYTTSGYTGKTYDGTNQGGNNDEGNDEENTENKWIFYYNDTNWGNSTVYAYVWDAGNGDKTYLGEWPGSKMEINDKGMWEISFTTTDNIITPMVIFNNGQGGDSNQTKDLELKNNGIYNFNGYHSAGINSIAENSFISISVYNGEIVIKADKDGVISIISADGRSRNVSISSGVNYINNMPRGFYIIKGDGNLTKKVLL